MRLDHLLSKENGAIEISPQTRQKTKRGRGKDFKRNVVVRFSGTVRDPEMGV